MLQRPPQGEIQDQKTQGRAESTGKLRFIELVRETAIWVLSYICAEDQQV